MREFFSYSKPLPIKDIHKKLRKQQKVGGSFIRTSRNFNLWNKARNMVADGIVRRQTEQRFKVPIAQQNVAVGIFVAYKFLPPTHINHLQGKLPLAMLHDTTSQVGVFINDIKTSNSELNNFISQSN